MNYSQNDPRWKDAPMASGGYTIGKSGCLLTAYASILCDDGRSFTPPELDSWIIAHGGYVDGCINHGVLTPLMRFLDVRDCPNPDNTPVALFNFMLENGAFIVAKVDFDQGKQGVQKHWVRLLLNGLCMDPYDGVTKPLCPRYGNTPNAAIWRAVAWKSK